MIKHKISTRLAASLVLAAGLSCFSISAMPPLSGAERIRARTPSSLPAPKAAENATNDFTNSGPRHSIGLVMQPYSDALAKEKLTPQNEDLLIDGFRYRAEVGEGRGWVLETGPEGTKKFPIAHALGEKNVFYFLTPLEKGRLQTLPVAYDVKKREWLNMAASGIQHFPGERRPEEPFNWKEWPYTFNTACYGCHVSQLSSNYDLQTDTYHTTWAEPGINCETCHGPSAAHNAIVRVTPKGQPLPDLKIISTKTMTRDQRNDPHRAEEHLKAALKYDPKMSQAAYNLCILLSGDRVQEAVRFCREANALHPDDPRYAYTLAFYLHQSGETAEAVKVLKTVGEMHPDFRDAQVLLQEISATSPKR